MHAEFGIKREANQNLFLGNWECDRGDFHFHSQIELYFIDEGEMDVFVNDRYTRLGAGEMSVALSYAPHGYSTPEYSRSSTLIIPMHMCPEFVAATEHKRVTDPFIRDKGKVTRIKAAITELCRGEINDIEREGHIYVILGIVMGALDFAPAASLDGSTASRMLSYVNENYKNGITPASISEHFGYNQSYVSRFFRDSFGIGIKKYLTVLRLKNAVMLLDGGRHSITYCVLDSGFGSVRSFYRAFRDEFGCTPREYLASKRRGA